MNVQLLIDSIVRQVTVLLAQLATSGGIRAPLSHIANQVFFDLSNELAAQGISRKVSADMFGMALRAYIRKLRRLNEGRTDQGRTLWQAVLEFIRENSMVTRARLLERFERDGERELSAILHDLVESGLVFASGVGRHSVYRAADDQEIAQLSRLSAEEGLDELLWALIFRAGPVSLEELALQASRPASALQETIERLCQAGRVKRLPSGRLHAQELVIPLGSAVGWEAAVFDHLQAAVQTICQRLQAVSSLTPERTYVGGSTYTFDVWPGHPLEQAVKDQLAELRERCGRLRQQVSDYNQNHGMQGSYEQITTYVGQCSIERDLAEDGIERDLAEDAGVDHDA